MGTQLTFDNEGNLLSRLKILNTNGDLHEDDEDYNFEKEIDEDEEHRLCRNELI